MLGDSVEVVVIHLGASTPHHLAACAAQVHKVTGRAPILVDPRRGAAFRTPKLRRFRRLERLSHLGLQSFWRYAAERFFVLEALMSEAGLERCIHIESDSLLYVAPTALAEWLERTFGAAVATCPLTVDEDTGAIVYVGSPAALEAFNEGLLRLVELGPEVLLREHGGAMGNEMRMMHILRTGMGLAAALPTTVAEAEALEGRWVFDPASYGQYVDGTATEPGVRFVGAHHAVGQEFLAGRQEVRWMGDPRVPWVEPAGEPRRRMPLVNLHLHSKRLERFVDAEVPLELAAMRRPRLRDSALAARLSRARGRLMR
jgi:hypothetical protein